MSLFIKGMTIAYGRQPIVSDIRLPEVPAGSLVAVIGANAVGKSTLLKSLAGLLKYSGHASFETQQLGSMTHRQRINTIGYLPQTLPQATTLVAYELVYCACKASQAGLSAQDVDERIEQVFESLDIRDLALRKMCEMSGGQRQMIGLAQVLVRQPKLLLLDEPTSALDLHWQLNVLGAIRQQTLNQNAVAMVASHDLNLALRFCDQLLILAGGKVLAMGKPQDALTSANLRSAYGIEGRIESCSQGHPVVLADRAC